jgi:sugar phosphate isomerase/epimerase
MPVRLGINTCFAVKRWPEPEEWIGIVTQDLGLDCCQVSLDLIDPMLDVAATGAYAERARAVAAQHNLMLHSTFTGLAAYSWSGLLHPEPTLREAAMRWYERAIDFTAALGAKGTGGHIGALSVHDAHDEARARVLVDELRDRLRTLSRYASSQGLEFLMFENMAVTREYGYSIEEAVELAGIQADGGVPIVLCLDLGHPCALHTGTQSDDYIAWLRSPWPQTPVIHLQQSDRSGDHHWPFTREYNKLGLVRANDVLDVLRSWPQDTDVYLFLEAIHPFEADDDHVLDDLRQSISYWREAMAQAR